jgi:acetylornithine/succinyldiaminopimelate/putrescine aminotransferase
MLGVELDPKIMAFDLPGFGSRTATLVAQAVSVRMLVEHQVLVQSTAKTSAVIKVVPPLVIEADDVDRIIDAFAATVADLRRGRGAAIRSLLDMLGRAPDVVLRESIR